MNDSQLYVLIQLIIHPIRKAIKDFLLRKFQTTYGHGVSSRENSYVKKQLADMKIVFKNQKFEFDCDAHEYENFFENYSVADVRYFLQGLKYFLHGVPGTTDAISDAVTFFEAEIKNA